MWGPREGAPDAEAVPPEEADAGVAPARPLGAPPRRDKRTPRSRPRRRLGAPRAPAGRVRTSPHAFGVARAPEALSFAPAGPRAGTDEVPRPGRGCRRRGAVGGGQGQGSGGGVRGCWWAVEPIHWRVLVAVSVWPCDFVDCAVGARTEYIAARAGRAPRKRSSEGLEGLLGRGRRRRRRADAYAATAPWGGGAEGRPRASGTSTGPGPLEGS